MVLVADSELLPQKALEEKGRGEREASSYVAGELERGVTLKSAFLDRTGGRVEALRVLSDMLAQGQGLLDDRLTGLSPFDGNRLIVCGVNANDHSQPISIVRTSEGVLERETGVSGFGYIEADEEIPRIAVDLALGNIIEGKVSQTVPMPLGSDRNPLRPRTYRPTPDPTDPPDLRQECERVVPRSGHGRIANMHARPQAPRRQP